MIAEVFAREEVTCLIYRTNQANLASVALAEKCGGVLTDTTHLADRVICKYLIHRG